MADESAQEDYGNEALEDPGEGGGGLERPQNAVSSSSVEAVFHRLSIFDSPDRMILTDAERTNAINIKEAIAANPELHHISDFMCAQLALVVGNDIDGAIERAYRLQWFREEYGVMDTAEDGSRCMAAYINLFPRMHLSFAYFSEGGNYVIVYDNAQFDSRQLKSEAQLRTWLGGAYYTCAAFCPDFESIRAGCVIVAECEG